MGKKKNLTFVPFEKSLLSLPDKQYSLFLKPFKDYYHDDDDDGGNDDDDDDDNDNDNDNNDNDNDNDNDNYDNDEDNDDLWLGWQASRPTSLLLNFILPPPTTACK